MDKKKPLINIPFVDMFAAFRPKKQRIMNYNPTINPATREDAAEVKITVFDYDVHSLAEKFYTEASDCFQHSGGNTIKWINVDGINKQNVSDLSKHFGIHPLLTEDILSVGQRAKMDEIDNTLFCLLPMLYFNPQHSIVEQEQVSMVLGKNFVISFQEDPKRDVFDMIRNRLRISNSKLRLAPADYLLYSLLDVIVDHYFLVLDKLGERIEMMEDIIPRRPDNRTLAHINHLRKQTLFLKRAIAPVREVVNGIIKSDNDLLQENTEKYFKDVYDHIIQANDLADNYRDMVVNLQELYHTQTNLKMNEVMKLLAVVTTLMAPLTLIAGIYGMNFNNMPELKAQNGYFYTLGAMFIILLGMIIFFRKRKWF
ncbi:magnesium and cobalt transport protein CorA [Chitinophaga caeni]|uniref:Magnesium transport protein CorA n=1 Tax=Chitinophaga caeni TaxID=2029983 RepID=A0A291QRK4_9BACT|nr:magnesium/cobalt transporter CorA [Chitinophaga caeni]ATL46639.1 magnesium and cobalt transport protein CorA [Chitinophaga caeni]